MQKNKNFHDQIRELVIIGGGPAGISAGIYAALDNIDYLLIENSKSCQFMEHSINSHYYVSGFIGSSEKITGTKLKNNFLQHYKILDGKIIKEKVNKLYQKENNKIFLIETNKRPIYARAVILASGTTPKKLTTIGVNNFKKHIHYDCISDGDRYKNKNVLVVGGRNSGVVAACYLHDIGCNVLLIEIKDKLQAKNKYQKWLKEKKIKVFISSELSELKKRGNLLEAIINTPRGIKPFKVSGVFSYIGRLPNFDFCKIKMELKEDFIIVDHKNMTSVPGLFAAGDITCRLKQIITACGDGANAYYFAKKYIDSFDSFKMRDID